jgi:hypothetical protein
MLITVICDGRGILHGELLIAILIKREIKFSFFLKKFVKKN